MYYFQSSKVFLIKSVYIKDLPDTALCEMKLSADDSKLLSVINNDVDVSNKQKDLVVVTQWTNQWDMRLNLLEKCMAQTQLCQKQSKSFVYLRRQIGTNKGDWIQQF